MGQTKRKYKHTSINPSKHQLYNVETYELRTVRNAYLWESSATSEIEVSYNQYIYLDTNQIVARLSKGLKQVDLALLISISNRLLNKYNIVMHDKDKPHSTASIAKLVGETPHSVRNKLRRLEKQGLIAYKKLEDKKSWGKVYIVNPHFIKKGRDYKDCITKLFEDPNRN